MICIVALIWVIGRRKTMMRALEGDLPT
jgi:hypothetical protein